MIQNNNQQHKHKRSCSLFRQPNELNIWIGQSHILQIKVVNEKPNKIVSVFEYKPKTATAHDPLVQHNFTITMPTPRISNAQLLKHTHTHK